MTKIGPKDDSVLVLCLGSRFSMLLIDIILTNIIGALGNIWGVQVFVENTFLKNSASLDLRIALITLFSWIRINQWVVLFWA